MKTLISIAVLLVLAVPSFAKTHRYNYDAACSSLWPAVKDAVRNSGKYGIIGISNEEMTVSYTMGGTWSGKATNSVVLNKISTGCEMQIQSQFRGITHNDQGDLKKRVDASLAK